ncbi:MAG: tetratricopeptide repeat protein [Deltaproteobacteria bacterium]|nr:tetratricopeptide repeat protein [Deltaproteobacteria bacterium]
MLSTGEERTRMTRVPGCMVAALVGLCVLAGWGVAAAEPQLVDVVDGAVPFVSATSFEIAIGADETPPSDPARWTSLEDWDLLLSNEDVWVRQQFELTPEVPIDDVVARVTVGGWWWEVWADGVRVRSVGARTSKSHHVLQRWQQSTDLPREALSDRKVSVAFRIHHTTGYGLWRSPKWPLQLGVGSSATVGRSVLDEYLDVLVARWSLWLVLLMLLGTAWSHALLAVRLRERIHFLMAMVILSAVLHDTLPIVLPGDLPDSFAWRLFNIWAWIGLLVVAQLMRELLGDRRRWTGAALGIVALQLPIMLLPPTHLMLPVYNVTLRVFGLLWLAGMGVGVVALARRGFREADAYWRTNTLAVLSLVVYAVLYEPAVFLGFLSPSAQAAMKVAAPAAFFAFFLLLGQAQAIRAQQITANLLASIEALERLNDATARFVPTAFLERLGESSVVDIGLGDAVEAEMTVLFSDIRSFTTLSEGMTPKENFAFINEYLERMEPEVAAAGGFIDKYIGDAVMALFASADAAVRACIGMSRALEALNTERTSRGDVAIAIGMGLNTGRLMLGTVGGPGRMDGTVISDAVNLAARVEGMTKTYGVSLLITERTVEGLAEPGAFVLRPVDRVAVKGKAEPVDVYEVVDCSGAAERELKKGLLVDSAAGVSAWRSGDFDGARAAFEAALAACPGDKVAALYLQRLDELEREGVPEDWSPVIRRMTK